MSEDSLTYPAAQAYVTSLVPPREEELMVMEAYAEEHDFPIIGPACRYYCYQLARMIQARSIFELGSGFGYSTAWFAKAVRETCTAEGRSDGSGVVHHTVWDEDLSNRARSHLVKLGSADLVQFHLSEAVEALKKTDGPFDIIFNDIDKEGYPDSLPVIKEKLRSGGILIIDNMLWSGRIFDSNDAGASTAAIRRFIHTITTDPDWIVSLTPMRDAMIVAYKK